MSRAGARAAAVAGVDVGGESAASMTPLREDAEDPGVNMIATAALAAGKEALAGDHPPTVIG